MGIVVRDVNAALRDLAVRVDPAWGMVQPVWGEAFGCHIARRVRDDTEYEFIEPVRESFLRAFLLQEGSGVHHLSFEVGDLNRCLDLLRSRGVPMADPVVRQGLCGPIAFVAPGRWGARCLELCQVVEHKPKAEGADAGPLRRSGREGSNHD